LFNDFSFCFKEKNKILQKKYIIKRYLTKIISINNINNLTYKNILEKKEKKEKKTLSFYIISNLFSIIKNMK